MARYSIEQILDALNGEKTRATYSAVAPLRGIHPKMLAAQDLGNRRPYASWVVRKATGMPTDYLPANCHPELQSKIKIIDDPADLIAVVGRSQNRRIE